MSSNTFFQHFLVDRNKWKKKVLYNTENSNTVSSKIPLCTKDSMRNWRLDEPFGGADLQGSLQGGGERPLRFRVPPISTMLISSVEHWNTST